MWKMKKSTYSIILLLFAASTSLSQVYEWKQVGKLDRTLNPFWIFFHVDSTNRIYVCTEWFYTQFKYSDDEGKTWQTKADSTFIKDYFGYSIGLDSNGIIATLDISEFGKNTSKVPNPVQWFIEKLDYLKTNKNPWIKVSKSNKIFLPTFIVLTSKDSGKYWKMNDILNSRPEGHFYWTDSLRLHFQKQSATSILVDNDDRIIVSSRVGIYSSENDGLFWKKQNYGLTDSSIAMIRMSKDGSIFAISDSGRIFKGTLSPNSIQFDKPNTPSMGYLLFQNYPNPFNPSTVINFTIPRDEFVRIGIYNVLGAEIEVIMNETLSRGVHSVRWEAKNHPSGLYFYQIHSGGYSETRKMLLLR